MLRNLTIFLILLLLGNVFCAAQYDRQKYAPPGLVLEVSYNDESKPSYIYVTDHILQSRGNLFSNFQRVGKLRQAGESFSVKAVRIVSRPEAGAVKVKISVVSGQKPNEIEQPVAEYTLRENDRVTVSDLKRFGVEPFEIRAAALTLASSDLPQIINKTNSLTVEKIEPFDAEIPSVRVVLVNNSDKAVNALTYKITVGKSPRSSSRPESTDGNILIKPGERFQAIIPNAGFGVKNTVGQTVALEPNRTITISAAVFEDDSFEGDAAEASKLMIVKFAGKLQTKKILNLLTQTAESDSALSVLREKAENLNSEIDENEFSKFASRFADLPENEIFYLRSAANAVLKEMKRVFIDETESFNQGQKTAESAETRHWLKTLKEKYQNSLSRLD